MVEQTEAPATLPADAELLASLREQPRTLKEICEHFDVPYCYSTVRRSPDGMDYGYTPETKAVRNQLQRLRLARKISCRGTRWEVR